jgi:uncharacterized protein YecT (DUF1311 family)
MTRIFAVLLALLVSACGSSKLDGTYSNNMTGVAEQKMSFTFKPDGTARMAIGSAKIPLEMAYEVSGNKIKVAGQNGDVIFTIMENGDLLMNGIRLTKETASQAAETPSIAKPTEQPAPIPASNPAPTPAPVAEKAQPSPQVTWSPSFDCAKASSFSEKTICTDTLLGKLDGALAENYKYMLASDIGDGARNDLKATQRKWLAERNKCTDNQCLANAYQKRIDEVCEYPVISGVHPVCISSDEIK